MKQRPDFTASPTGAVDDTLLSTKQVGEIFGLSAETIRDWCNGGQLESIKLPNGQLRIRRGDVVKFAQSKYGTAQ